MQMPIIVLRQNMSRKGEKMIRAAAESYFKALQQNYYSAIAENYIPQWYIYDSAVNATGSHGTKNKNKKMKRNKKKMARLLKRIKYRS